MTVLGLFMALIIDVGGVDVLALEGELERIAVGNGQVLEARQVASNEVLLLGLAEGHSQIMVWHGAQRQRFDIQVVAPRQSQRAIPVIELEVQVMEFKQRELQGLGLRWQQLVNGPALAVLSDWSGGHHFRPAAAVSTEPALDTLNLPAGHYASFGLTSSLTSQLQLLAEKGVATMLASPILRTESGQQAHFLAGGEVPLPQSNLQGAMDVSFRQYGVQLSIAPEMLDDGSIRTAVTTEVSNLDAAVTVQGIPGLLTRRTESVVAVQPGESFVISGLRSEQQDQQWSGLPGVQQTPIVGAAFRHQQQQQQHTELVIFITPRVVTDDALRQQQRMAEVKQIRDALLTTPCRGMKNYLAIPLNVQEQ